MPPSHYALPTRRSLVAPQKHTPIDTLLPRPAQANPAMGVPRAITAKPHQTRVLPQLGVADIFPEARGKQRWAVFLPNIVWFGDQLRLPAATNSPSKAAHHHPTVPAHIAEQCNMDHWNAHQNRQKKPATQRCSITPLDQSAMMAILRIFV